MVECVAVSRVKGVKIKLTFVKSVFVEIADTWIGIGDDGRRDGDGGEEEG
jgi:hypothetical protein